MVYTLINYLVWPCYMYPDCLTLVVTCPTTSPTLSLITTSLVVYLTRDLWPSPPTSLGTLPRSPHPDSRQPRVSTNHPSLRFLRRMPQKIRQHRRVEVLHGDLWLPQSLCCHWWKGYWSICFIYCYLYMLLLYLYAVAVSICFICCIYMLYMLYLYMLLLYLYAKYVVSIYIWYYCISICYYCILTLFIYSFLFLISYLTFWLSLFTCWFTYLSLIYILNLHLVTCFIYITLPLPYLKHYHLPCLSHSPLHYLRHSPFISDILCTRWSFAFHTNFGSNSTNRP